MQTPGPTIAGAARSQSAMPDRIETIRSAVRALAHGALSDPSRADATYAAHRLARAARALGFIRAESAALLLELELPRACQADGSMLATLLGDVTKRMSPC
jgi:hypothetical protein